MSTDKTLADVQPGGRVRLGDALLPCPLCGNDAEFVPYKNNGLTLKCKSMGCIQRHQRTLRYGIEWLRTSMTEHWNTRALSAQPSPATCKEGLQVHPSPGGRGWSVSDEMVSTASRAYHAASEVGSRNCMRSALEAAIDTLAARQPVGELVAIPEGWALVDLAEYTVLPQIPTTAMMDAGWPIGEQITDRFDVKGAYADLIAEHDAKGEGIIHGPSQQPAQAVDLGQFRVAVYCMQKYTGVLPRKYWDKGSKAFDEEAARLMTVIDGAEVARG